MASLRHRHPSLALGLIPAGATLALLVSLVATAPVSAHDDLPATQDAWGTWNWQPAVLLGLMLAGWLYGRGTAALWRRAGAGRGVRFGQAAAFASGLTALFVALVSPLDALASALFSAHMVQHLLLILVAAPLLVISVPLVPLLWALPLRCRRLLGGSWQRIGGLRTGWHVLTQPLVVGILSAIALWLWHAPSFYNAALQNEGVHAAEHASFLVTALLFWWVVLHPGPRDRSDYGAALLLIFATMLQTGGLGALLTFARTPWYAAYTDRALAWGLTPLEDQQLAGLIMWVPMGTVYLGFGLWLVATWLRAQEAASTRSERRRLAASGSPAEAVTGHLRATSQAPGGGTP